MKFDRFYLSTLINEIYNIYAEQLCVHLDMWWQRFNVFQIC